MIDLLVSNSRLWFGVSVIDSQRIASENEVLCELKRVTKFFQIFGREFDMRLRCNYHVIPACYIKGEIENFSHSYVDRHLVDLAVKLQ